MIDSAAMIAKIWILLEKDMNVLDKIPSWFLVFMENLEIRYNRSKIRRDIYIL